MKNLVLLVISALINITFGVIIYNTPSVDLPEEYELITKADNLKGYYTADGVLHIEFDNDNNGIKFIWNDDEESIPIDGSLITLEHTDENTVYIGPYNKSAKTE